MVPAAPGRFSTTTGCPSAWTRRSATLRAVTSFAPPGGKGTIQRIGFDGQVCAMAHAAHVKASSSVQPILKAATRMGVLVPF